MDNDSIKIMEAYKSQLVDDKPYDTRFDKPKMPKANVDVELPKLIDFKRYIVESGFAQSPLDVNEMLVNLKRAFPKGLTETWDNFLELNRFMHQIEKHKRMPQGSNEEQDVSGNSNHLESVQHDAVLTEGTHKCDKCGKGMGKHHNEEKAKRGYKYCQSCDRTYSPEATTKVDGKGISAPSIKKD